MTGMQGTISGKFPFSPVATAGKDNQKNGA